MLNSTALRATLEQDIKDHVLRNLPYNPVDTPALAQKRYDELLSVYWNWLGRLVSPVPRSVRISNELAASPYMTDPLYAQAITDIQKKILTGDDLSPHLSRGITEAVLSPSGKKKKLHQRKDLDLLLTAWSVHHLHLSTSVEADGFVTRTGPLLFAVFRDDQAYLVNIFDHGAWYDEDVLRIIVRNWPDDGLMWKMEGMALEPSLDEAGRKALRNNAINSATTVDGTLYRPARGTTSNGTSVFNQMRLIHLNKAIDRLIKAIELNPNHLQEAMEESGLVVPDSFDLHFVFREDGHYGLRDTGTGTFFKLSS